MGEMVSPWRRLNLRRNPFGEPPPDVVADLVVLPDETELVARLRAPGSFLQILGDAGRGKTARMRRLQRLFPGVPYVYLCEEKPLPELPPLVPRPDGGPGLLLDEAQRLPRRRRRRLLRRASRLGTSLAVASHEDLAGEARTHGLIVHSCTVSGIDEERLLQILNRRVEWARASDGSLPRLTREDARGLIARFGDDLRSLLDQLYEDYQHLLATTEEERWRSVS